MLRLSALSLAMVVAGAAQAQGVITTQKLSAALANELVGESVAQCARKSGRVLEWAGAAVQRVPRLLGAVGRLTPILEERRELSASDAVARRRLISHARRAGAMSAPYARSTWCVTNSSDR